MFKLFCKKILYLVLILSIFFSDIKIGISQEISETEDGEVYEEVEEELPPLEILSLKPEKIFSANYKYYSENPVAYIVLQNNSLSMLEKVKISFYVRGFMDFPSEKLVDIPPDSSLEVPIFATFNTKILEITEDMPVQAEIKVAYFWDSEQTITRNIQFTFYSRNALIWDTTDKLAAFVTPKDEILKEFARLVVAQYGEEIENIPLPYNITVARIIFAALGAYGIVYVPDPTNPYLSKERDKEMVDYVQFPRETLKNKSGDCDDLTTLFSAALENIAISTSLVDVPGHIFVMFDSGFDETTSDEFGFSQELYIPYDGTLWIPIEATMIGRSFLNAWKEAAKEYNRWKKENKLKIIDLQKAWKIYKPATLPREDFKVNIPTKDKIEEKFKNDWDEIINLRIQNLVRTPQEILDINPYDISSYQELGLIYAEHKKYDDAEKYFKKVVELNPYDAGGWNNLGNIYIANKNYQEAIKCYTKALQFDKNDVGILVNLSLAYWYVGDISQAKEYFSRAEKLDKNVIYQYESLYNLLR